MKYRVELQAVTRLVLDIEAEHAEEATESAIDQAYDGVHEVDRSAWRVERVHEARPC